MITKFPTLNGEFSGISEMQKMRKNGKFEKMKTRNSIDCIDLCGA